MKCFELLSDGMITALPEHGDELGVTVFLPWGRRIEGTLVFHVEQWRLCSERHEEEFFLPEEGDWECRLPAGSVRLDESSIQQIRKTLLGQYTPPGDHRLTIWTLREMMPRIEIFHATSADSETVLLPRLSSWDGTLQLYWGVRMALWQQRDDGLSRLRSWARRGASALFWDLSAVRMALSASKEMPEGLLEPTEQVAGDVDLDAEQASPEASLLIRYDAVRPFGSASLSAWFVLPRSFWSEILSGQSSRDAILALWGAMEAHQAWRYSELFRPLAHQQLDQSFC